MPVMMFAILFGLSMDYEVFLISRIREEYLKDGDTRRAVADGLAKTARVITAAAAIMVVVFLAFLAAPDVFLKLFGIGLASAIFLDATVVRMVLVPAVMQLLGDRNWWIPNWLERILPGWTSSPPRSGPPKPARNHAARAGASYRSRLCAPRRCVSASSRTSTGDWRFAFSSSSRTWRMSSVVEAACFVADPSSLAALPSSRASAQAALRRRRRRRDPSTRPPANRRRRRPR